MSKIGITVPVPIVPKTRLPFTISRLFENCKTFASASLDERLFSRSPALCPLPQPVEKNNAMAIAEKVFELDINILAYVTDALC